MGPIFIWDLTDDLYPDVLCAKKKDQLTLALPKLLLYRKNYFFFFLVDFFVVFLAAFLVAFFAFFLAMVAPSGVSVLLRSPLLLL